MRRRDCVRYEDAKARYSILLRWRGSPQSSNFLLPGMPIIICKRRAVHEQTCPRLGMHRNLVESVDVWIAGNFELQASSNVQRLLEIKTVCRRLRDLLRSPLWAFMVHISMIQPQLTSMVRGAFQHPLKNTWKGGVPLADVSVHGFVS